VCLPPNDGELQAPFFIGGHRLTLAVVRPSFSLLWLTGPGEHPGPGHDDYQP